METIRIRKLNHANLHIDCDWGVAEELKEFLESVSLTEKLKAEAEESNAQREVLAKAPLNIYIG